MSERDIAFVMLTLVNGEPIHIAPDSVVTNAQGDPIPVNMLAEVISTGSLPFPQWLTIEDLEIDDETDDEENDVTVLRVLDATTRIRLDAIISVDEAFLPKVEAWKRGRRGQ